MSDTILQIENDKGELETWVTIKDASDLLGISERHAWNIISGKDYKGRQKRPAMKTTIRDNNNRKKTYVKRSDIEKYYQAEQERQRLDALKTSPLSERSEMPGMKDEFERSERTTSPLSESGMALSESRKSLPALLKEMQEREKTLQTSVVKWKTSLIWVGILGLVTASTLTLSLNEVKKALSERENRLSESQKALSEMSERALTLSERQNEAIKTLSEREDYIRKLEDNIDKSKLDILKLKENRE